MVGGPLRRPAGPEGGGVCCRFPRGGAPGPADQWETAEVMTSNCPRPRHGLREGVGEEALSVWTTGSFQEMEVSLLVEEGEHPSDLVAELELGC